MIHSI